MRRASGPALPDPSCKGPSGSATRDRLLEAAVRVFARSGYYGATVDDIVAQAGLSKGAFYFYFPSKEALLVTLLEDFAEALARDIQRAVEGTSGAQARVESALKAGIGTFAAHPDLARVFLVEAVGVKAELERKRRELIGRFCNLIQGYLEMAVAEGDIPPADTALMARAIFGAIHEVVVHHLTARDAGDIQRAVRPLARFILRGAGWQIPP